jgi:triacylglycerol lipase
MPILRRLVNLLLLLLSMNILIVAALSGAGPVVRSLMFLAALTVIVVMNIFPVRVRNSVARLRTIKKSRELMILFAVTFSINTALNITVGATLVPEHIKWWIFTVNIGLCLLFELVLLMNGLTRVFFTSLQLGIKWRVLLFFFWWTPVVNIILIKKVCAIISREYDYETEKTALNGVRRDCCVCRTKYPLLLVHGVFFRDFRYINYWGRIPKELRKNGAVVFHGEQQSAASVKESAEELKQRIEQIVGETGCGKVNIIAHSKGGLDARYTVSRLGMDRYVATLTTVNTPHRGCNFADHLLEKASERLREGIARKYNAALKRMGDKDPDFISAVTDLTAKRCEAFNQEVPDMDGVYYQSVASKMNRWTSGKFPLNLSYGLVSRFDGENDGLVSVESAKWGSNWRVVTAQGSRGISHGDMIDLNRENIDGFDVREFYVDLVKELKAMGY